MLRKLVLISAFFSIALLAVACNTAAPAEIVVTRVVEVPGDPQSETIEVTRIVEGETVTEMVEVTRVVEVEAGAKPAGTLIVALSTFPNSLDMPVAAERNATNASWPLYDSLVTKNEDGLVEPALAESWDISDDGVEYTFHLREGVTFHDGQPFNADAVVFSWERGTQPDMQWSDRWTRAASVEKVDDYTVKIATNGPDPIFLRTVAENWAIVPANFDPDAPIGTGPFKLVEWVTGDRIVYEANLDYWQEGKPRLEQVIFRPIPESSTRVAAIQTGEVHIVGRLSSEEAQSLLGAPGVQVVRYPVDRVYYIAFNNLTTGVGQPTEDPRVRQALNYAVDRQAIVDALFNGFARLSTGYVTPANLGYDDSLEPYPYDPDKARELLADAGYPDGFSIGFACPIGAYTNFDEVCEAIQGYLGEVGVETELDMMESGQYWDLEAEKELPPLFGDSWSETSGEALPRLRGALGGFDASFSAWSDPEIDRLMDEIAVTVDSEARADLYVELQQYMYENPPFIYLYEPNTFEAINSTVQNYQPGAAEDYRLEDVFLAAP